MCPKCNAKLGEIVFSGKTAATNEIILVGANPDLSVNTAFGNDGRTVLTDLTADVVSLVPTSGGGFFLATNLQSLDEISGRVLKKFGANGNLDGVKRYGNAGAHCKAVSIDEEAIWAQLKAAISRVSKLTSSFDSESVDWVKI